MNIEAFWLILEESLRHSPARGSREAFLSDRLSSLPVTDMVDFQVHLDRACERAYTWDLWGAAMRIFGGWCSDDGFDYFRLWLVGRGRDVFERAVAAPDSLADAPEIRRLVARHPRTWDSDVEWPEWESLDYLAGRAFARATGDDDDCAEAFDDAVDAQLSDTAFAREPAGERWDARDEAAAAIKMPRLAALFRLDGLR